MSLLFAPVKMSPELQARLHLFGVLPAFSDLLKHSERARATLKNQRFRLRIRSQSILSADLLFSEGRCRFLRNTSNSPTVTLRFVSHRQLNRQFSGRGFSFPVPTRGASNVQALKVFSQLSLQLQNALVTPESGDAEHSQLHLRLTFGVALAAACELINHETFSTHLFANLPDWRVEFTIGHTDFRAWIGQTGGLAQWGRGAAKAPLAHLHFEDPKIAQKALGGKLDNLSAVTSGAIRVGGLTPLADRLSLVFERVPIYLPPPTAK
ncbi:MAG: hypothetical protein GVY36_11890 [Verrucomicrobia bacterium]|jgi:hypothetical protein|nr:hypothetical protein [Verrucomicrobiota bacterium]